MREAYDFPLLSIKSGLKDFKRSHVDKLLDLTSTSVIENPEVSILIFNKCLKQKMRVKQVIWSIPTWNIRFLKNEFEGETKSCRRQSSRK